LLRASSARNERTVDLQRIQAFFTDASGFADASAAWPFFGSSVRSKIE
jgi:hypothetical protein